MSSKFDMLYFKNFCEIVLILYLVVVNMPPGSLISPIRHLLFRLLELYSDNDFESRKGTRDRSPLATKGLCKHTLSEHLIVSQREPCELLLIFDVGLILSR